MDETLWHKCSTPFWPRRAFDGGWLNLVAGQCWRRKVDGRWQYRQDEETNAEWTERQW